MLALFISVAKWTYGGLFLYLKYLYLKLTISFLFCIKQAFKVTRLNHRSSLTRSIQTRLELCNLLDIGCCFSAHPYTMLQSVNKQVYYLLSFSSAFPIITYGGGAPHTHQSHSHSVKMCQIYQSQRTYYQKKSVAFQFLETSSSVWCF